MPLKRRDWIFLALIAAVVTVLLLASLRPQPMRTPDDARHRPLATAWVQGEGRETVEVRCIPCHNPQSLPLPTQHPPKTECLICHPLQG